jgi:hypothetical protein
MALPDTNLDDLLIDDAAETKVKPRNEAATDPAPDGWPMRPAENEQDDLPPNMRATMQQIGRTMQDITSGKATGEHPALDKLVGPRSARWPDTVCRPDCTHRTAPQYEPRQIITDVRPPVRERLAIAEHRINDLDEDMEAVKELSVRTSESAASREDLKERVQNVHTRIDRDIVPPLAALQKKRLLRDKIYPVWLTVSLILNIVTLYIITISEKAG